MRRSTRHQLGFFTVAFLGLLALLFVDQGGETTAGTRRSTGLAADQPLVPPGLSAVTGHIGVPRGELVMVRVESAQGQVEALLPGRSAPLPIVRKADGYDPPTLPNGTVIQTGADGTIILALIDGPSGASEPPEDSRLTVRPDSRMAIDQVIMPEGRAQLEGRSRARRIRSLLGWLEAKIDPGQRKLQTDFETPFGVAAVKGTELEIGVQASGSTSFGVKVGQLFVESAAGSNQGALGTMVLNLKAEQQITLLADIAGGQYVAQVGADTKGQIQVQSKLIDMVLTAGNDLVISQTGPTEAIILSNAGSFSIEMPGGQTVPLAPGVPVPVTLDQKIRLMVVSDAADPSLIQRQPRKGPDEDREASQRRPR